MAEIADELNTSFGLPTDNSVEGISRLSATLHLSYHQASFQFCFFNHPVVTNRTFCLVRDTHYPTSDVQLVQAKAEPSTCVKELHGLARALARLAADVCRLCFAVADDTLIVTRSRATP